MENVIKHKDIKLVTTERRRNYLVSEPNYYTTKFFTKNLLAIKALNEPVYLGLSRLDLIKTIMCEFWYDYIKPKYSENIKLCYMDTDNFIIHVKIDDIYKYIAEYVEKGFEASNYEIDRPLPKGTILIGYWITERLIRRTSHNRIFWIKRKNLQSFKRKKWWR